MALLAALCGILAVLQYRWIGEISGAERRRLQDALHDRLDDVRRDFNQLFSNAERALQPSPSQVEQLGREGAYSAQYLRWKAQTVPVFRRIGLAVPRGEVLKFFNLDLETARFAAAAWPSELSGIESRLLRRLHEEPAGPPEIQEPLVLETPRFSPGGPEQEWLLLEVDPIYIQQHLLPDLLARELGVDGKLEYDAQIVDSRDPSVVIYQSSPDAGRRIAQSPDGSVSLFDLRFANPPHGIPGARDDRGGLPPREAFGRGPGVGFAPPPGIPGAGPGLWRLRVRHQAGSLEALVAQTRRRNVVVSASLLVLILGVVVLLLRLSRRVQQLAELQINFVAGVSHELRTPLAVIRTAAFNLRGKLAHQPAQVEQYGDLIQQESEKLGALVEQILRFASAKAGHVVRRREPVRLGSLIDRSLESTRTAL